ncbi:PQQ-binding-like beta-propeller repeat protein [Paraglaciecola aquimarina]|uniref:PQQ-binding-like beta-propeller repeat protein n=1 Tax=Paraglaciecola algarum TaxID=3050085 RepID=A0ABS9DAS3_9ALTE|nr:PQQ-binding-like beta-propeller repeat protein [Paraglaciecola sp. G1-23]MCF2950058.1 PQQ-binding-like beta-propeller repeat protein [Paraglaciecola sp. G1-23]
MDKLYLGIDGKAVCIDKKTGNIIWSTKLKSSSAVTNVFYDDGFIYAYSGGHLFCVDSKTGEIKWENGLSGYGYGACIMASESQNAAAIADQVAAQAQQAVAASIVVASTTTQSSN